MLRWWHRRSSDVPRLCTCGEPLEVRVDGVAQRWGGEPVSTFYHWHCDRCGDVEAGSR